MTKRALVTGAAGFIGGALAKELVGRDWEVTVIDNAVDTFDAYERAGINAENEFKADFDDDGILELIHKNQFDYVFHQAAIARVPYSIKHPVETTESNVMRTIRLLDACRDSVRRVVFASSSSVYGDVSESDLPLGEARPRNPASPYALQKAFIEQYAEMAKRFHGQDIVCLRYFNVFGPGQTTNGAYSTVIPAWCEAIKEGRSLRLDGDGSQTRDFVYIDNVVDANIKAALSINDLGGEVLNIAGGNSVSLSEILGWFRARYNVKVNQVPFREGDIMHTGASMMKSKTLIGYIPKVGFWDGMEKTTEWWELEQRA